MDEHRLAEARSLAYLRLVAERVRQDPAVAVNARRRVERWLAEGRAPYYAAARQRVLSGPIADLSSALRPT